MYAVQKSASSTRMTGVLVTASVVAIVGYAVSTGIGIKPAPPAPAPLVIELLEAPKETVPEPLPPVEIEEIKPTLNEPPPLVASPIFEVVETPTIFAPVDVAPVEAAPGPAVGSDRIAPRIRAGNEPPYPPQSVRAQEQGVSGLDLCINARGQVTSARIARSSGYPRLDEAALKWVRETRFTPGSVGGVPQSMCGHGVDYEWRLRNGR